MKTLLITVDTEGDNSWNWRPGDAVTTENARFIPRFQELCEQFGFIPTWLTALEMAESDVFVSYISPKRREGLCEVGMHMHAWNTPPDYELPELYSGNPYITEYPEEIIAAKSAYTVKRLQERFEAEIGCHRSGRWATNESYFRVLRGLGIRTDCSVTPGLSYQTLAGRSAPGANDYTHAPTKPYVIYPGITEVPMTTRFSRYIGSGGFKRRIRTLVMGEHLWFRPIKKFALNDLIHLQKIVEAEKTDYLELMLHSSELMPGGSPYFTDVEAVERLYGILRQLFEHMERSGYQASALNDYARNVKA